MFTGIIQAQVKLLDQSTEGNILKLKVSRPEGWDLTLGQSISHNGVCLTVIEFDDESYTVELMPETLDKSTFGEQMPDTFNAERAMAADGLFEGHIVQGHVDSVVVLIEVIDEPDWRTLKISYPADKQDLLVDKGSVSLDGVSLTVVEAKPDWFSVSLIPHTLENTGLGKLKAGDKLNIEYDIIGKYLQKQRGGNG